jgi:hypothetical protein
MFVVAFILYLSLSIVAGYSYLQFAQSIFKYGKNCSCTHLKNLNYIYVKVHHSAWL